MRSGRGRGGDGGSREGASAIAMAEGPVDWGRNASVSGGEWQARRAVFPVSAGGVCGGRRNLVEECRGRAGRSGSSRGSVVACAEMSRGGHGAADAWLIRYWRAAAAAAAVESEVAQDDQQSHLPVQSSHTLSRPLRTPAKVAGPGRAFSNGARTAVEAATRLPNDAPCARRSVRRRGHSCLAPLHHGAGGRWQPRGHVSNASGSCPSDAIDGGWRQTLPLPPSAKRRVGDVRGEMG